MLGSCVLVKSLLSEGMSGSYVDKEKRSGHPGHASIDGH